MINQESCTNCGVPMPLHGTACGWSNAISLYGAGVEHVTSGNATTPEQKMRMAHYAGYDVDISGVRHDLSIRADDTATVVIGTAQEATKSDLDHWVFERDKMRARALSAEANTAELQKHKTELLDDIAALQELKNVATTERDELRAVLKRNNDLLPAGNEHTDLRMLLEEFFRSYRERCDGVGAIAKERREQVSKGWTQEHDSEHQRGEIARAAMEYLEIATSQIIMTTEGSLMEAKELKFVPASVCWPWEVCTWRPADNPLGNLIKAGALIAAEIDRLKHKDGADTKSRPAIDPRDRMPDVERRNG